MTYAFTFDAKFCSGCKACQAACKDKNNLPAGVLWRHVYEVSGGAWQSVGDAWTNSVFAYNLSMSCNHCEHPKCAGVCPVDAYSVRKGGIVFLDTTKCMGCGYCAWACPYGAPQYNPKAGHMTKCDFCLDQLELGLPPACVAACPMRVLDVTESGEQTEENSLEADGSGQMELWNTPGTEHPFPLPAFSRTEPHLAIRPHPAMNNAQEKTLANVEEIQPRRLSPWEEAPLILFTLLGQLAVGGYWTMSLLFQPLWTFTERFAPSLRLIPVAVVGISLGLALAASFAHLGTKRNAWRALTHLSHSWLSREILFAGLFGLGWLVSAGELLLLGTTSMVTMGIASALGLGLVYSMAQVYRLRSAPGWDSPHTNAGFLVTAALMGSALMTPLLAHQSEAAGIQIPPSLPLFSAIGILILLSIQIILGSWQKQSSPLRLGLILLGMALTVAGAIRYNAWLGIFIFVVVVAEEFIGRWRFYQSRLQV